MKNEEFEINDPVVYLRNKIAEFRKYYPQIVATSNQNALKVIFAFKPELRKRYNEYRNYLLALSHYSVVRDIALSEGYDGDTFVYSYLPEVRYDYLEDLVYEKLAQKASRMQEEETNKNFKREKILRKTKKNNINGR